MTAWTTADLLVATEKSITGLFHTTYSAVQQWERGQYFVLFARPSKRVQSILSVDRELLIVGNTYTDQQPRTLAFAQRLIRDSNRRLEPRVILVLHRDPKGNSKLKNWGREAGISVIPVYVSSDPLPTGADFERLLSFEFFSQDPFDVTGPVASDAQFFGRRTEAQELARKLQGGQIRAIFGIRKIGKTSIMHRVVQEIGNNYDAITVFIDCQKDSIFSLHASNLLCSIAATLSEALETSQSSIELVVLRRPFPLHEASQLLTETIARVDRPVILAFDEVDYITPGSPTASHWRTEFIEFWRNVRAAYQEGLRQGKKLSILVSGVSSKWFSVESVNGVENAALAFVPEEYLTPLPRGAAIAMIKTISPTAGLNFDEGSAAHIAASCSDMPFWIRKACSFIHGRTDASRRPLTLSTAAVQKLVADFIRDEGAAMAQVALQHLFRVYPELRPAALDITSGHPTRVAPATLRILTKYGIIAESNLVSGEMVRAGLVLSLQEHVDSALSIPAAPTEGGNALALELGDWAEELQVISRRRNIIEKRLRELVVNFVKYSSLAATEAGSAKVRILGCIPAKRRALLEALSVDQISEKIFWLELASIVQKEWSLFSKIFGDQARFRENVELVNDRPDAHAKDIDLADVALYRRSLTWFEERLDRV